MMPDQDADSDSSGAAATFSTLNSIASNAQ
jgi:hypothetical protein